MHSWDHEITERLVREARKGNEEALSELLERHRSLVLASLASTVSNPETCKDLVQEVLVKAAKALPALKDNRAFPAWILKIARHTACNYYRDNRADLEAVSLQQVEETAVSTETLQGIGPLSCPHYETQARMSRETLLNVIRAACTREQAFALLAAQEDWTYAEIGWALEQITGTEVSEGTVGSHISRAKTAVLHYMVLNRHELVGGVEGVRRAAEMAAADITEKERQTLLNLRDPREDETATHGVISHPETSRGLSSKLVKKIARFIRPAILVLLILWRAGIGPNR